MKERSRQEAVNEEVESDGSASDDSSEKDADSDEKVENEEEDDNSIISSESKHTEEMKKKAKKSKKKIKKKKEKEKKDKKDKDKKKKKLPPVQAPDYIQLGDPRSHHSRVSGVSTISAITIPKPLRKIAKNHSGPPPVDVDYPPETQLGERISAITLPKNIGGGDLVDDSQRSGRVSLLSNGPEDSQGSVRISALSQLDTSLLDG